EECGLAGAGESEPAAAVKAGGSPKARPQAPVPDKAAPLALLDHLRAEHERHSQRVEQRRGIPERGKGARIEYGEQWDSAVGGRRRGEALFQTGGVADEPELRQLAAKLDEADDLKKKRVAVTREITAAIGKHGTEADFAPLLADDQIGRLEHDWEALSTQ